MTPGNKNKDRPSLKWTPESKEAFDRRKKRLQRAALLSHPASGADLSLWTDASDFAAWAVLHQRPYLRPTAALKIFIKKVWKGTAQLLNIRPRANRYVFDRTTLTLSVRWLRNLYLHGPQTSNFHISPDSQHHLAASSQTTWLHLEILHWPPPTYSHESKLCTRHLRSILNVSQKRKPKTLRSPTYSTAKNADPRKHKMSIYLGGIIRPYKSFWNQLQHILFDPNHPRARGAAKLMTEWFVWLDVKRDAQEFARNCLACQRIKVGRHMNNPHVPYPATQDRFSHIKIDIIGPFPISNGNYYYLTIDDRYTRWPEAIPNPDIKATMVVSALLYHWIAWFVILFFVKQNNCITNQH